MYYNVTVQDESRWMNGRWLEAAKDCGNMRIKLQLFPTTREYLMRQGVDRKKNVISYSTSYTMEHAFGRCRRTAAGVENGANAEAQVAHIIKIIITIAPI